MNKKLKKLKNNPKLFFKDMLEKRFNKYEIFLKKFAKKKKNGYSQYTVVSAVYNVDKYLDDYFESLISQNLNFINNIYLILVDDGSTDNSAQIIKKWQKKYPKNINYIYKENGGQASARNLGLEYVTTDWVTFIDPDDFVDPNYFLALDDYIFINKDKDIKMIGCNLVFYYEDLNVYKNTHPLRYKFNMGNKLIKLENLKNNIQLSASTCFFITKKIKQANLEFDIELKPNFEDAKFIGDYLRYLNNNDYISFIENSKYYYRKRQDASSTLDGSWKKIGKYSDVLERGYLKYLIDYYNINETIPHYVKETILYDLSWHLKYLINHPEKIDFLTQNEKENYLILLDRIFSYIDNDFIISYNPSQLWFYHKVGILGCFKKEKPDFQICYIEEIDAKKRQICLRYFTSEKVFESIQLDGVDIIPDFIKTVQHDFVDRVFVYEQLIWIHIPLSAKKLKVFIDEKQARITYSGKQHQELDLKELNKAFSNNLSAYNSNEDIWILMDRDIQADDNAEHLYRYIAKIYPEKNIYFALKSSSHDWDRLKNEGFQLLDFGTSEYEKVFKKSSKIISSHIDGYIVNYFGKDTLKGKEFIFLQHGVIKDDLSKWLNPKKMDLFVTTTKDEYNSIAGDFNRYKFSKKNVIQSGLPRHDSLLANNNENSKTILVMPTWRHYIMGEVIGTANQRELNADFLSTDYAQHWLSFLKNPTLQNLVENYGFKVVYFPHANIQPYLPLFDLPDYIDILDHASIGMQELFQQASFMITDYSSVAFEMGILNKTVLYYQFDEDEFFSGIHTYQKGYFDYRQHGFGPITTEEENLLNELEKILINQGKPVEPYKKRIEETFAFRDSHNCQRVFDAIINLDLEYDENNKDPELAIKYAMNASEHQNWRLAESRWTYIKNILNLSNILIEEKLQEAINYNFQEDIYKIAKNIWNDGDYVKETILYDLSWHLKYLINHPEKIDFLTQNEKENYLILLDRIFSYIDNDFIISYNPSQLWFYHKVGILGCFKKEKPDFQICYIEEIDAKKRQICLRYFTSEKVFESIQLDGVDIIPDFIKTVQHDFVDRVFVYEQLIWIHIPLSAKKLKVFIDEKQARITYSGKQHQELDLKELNKAFSNNLSAYNSNEDIWILMDRDIQADDNAEHLYRYIAKIYPEKNIYFALKSSSHDWDRLKNEGFQLLDFGTSEYEKVFKKSSKIISSHIDGYIVNYFGKDTLKGKEFIFLQHGVIKDDLSKWLNPKKMDLFVTTTKDEYNSIAGDFNRYKFSKKNVIQSGLPRHDSLLANNNENSKTILVMPTWRHYIMGEVIGTANQRELNADFLSTDYAQHWLSFLKNPTLQNLVENYGFKVVYFPHANIQPYLPLFNLPDYIDIIEHTDIGIQKLFQQASFMLTDYSSVAFEMGILNKTVLYYQFDEIEFFAGDHVYQKGYFDYRQHGFGPVVTDELNLFNELEKILLNNGKPTEIYQTRIKQTFAFRDINNCKRTYDAILQLDESYDEKVKDIELALNYANKAYQAKEWKLAKQRFDYIENELNADLKEFKNLLLECEQELSKIELFEIAEQLWKDGDFEKAYYLLTKDEIRQPKTKDEYLLKVKLATLNKDEIVARESLLLAFANFPDSFSTQEWISFTNNIFK